MSFHVSDLDAGYGGDVTFSMGVTNDGTLNGYSITDISETAGLGMKAKEDGFIEPVRRDPCAESWKLPSLARQPIQRSKPSVVQRSHLRQLPSGVDAGLTYYRHLHNCRR